MKEGSLFCSYEIHRTGMLQNVFLISLGSSWQGVQFHDVWTCGAKVLEYWNFSSLRIKLNRSWKFRRNWNVPSVVLLERCDNTWANSTGHTSPHDGLDLFQSDLQYLRPSCFGRNESPRSPTFIWMCLGHPYKSAPQFLQRGHNSCLFALHLELCPQFMGP
jgi:hypothetical protein